MKVGFNEIIYGKPSHGGERFEENIKLSVVYEEESLLISKHKLLEARKTSEKCTCRDAKVSVRNVA